AVGPSDNLAEGAEVFAPLFLSRGASRGPYTTPIFRKLRFTLTFSEQISSNESRSFDKKGPAIATASCSISSMIISLETPSGFRKPKSGKGSLSFKKATRTFEKAPGNQSLVGQTFAARYSSIRSR